MLFFNILWFQLRSSPMPRSNHMPRWWGHLLYQRLPDALGDVLLQRILHQTHRKSLAWIRMMTELSRWTEIIIPSRPWYRKKFILGSYIVFFGKQAGRKIWGYHLIRMRRTRNGGRRKEDHRTLKAAATNTDTKSEEADDSKTVFSDLIFTVAAAPYQVQLHSA